MNDAYELMWQRRQDAADEEAAAIEWAIAQVRDSRSRMLSACERRAERMECEPIAAILYALIRLDATEPDKLMGSAVITELYQLARQVARGMDDVIEAEAEQFLVDDRADAEQARADAMVDW